MTVNQQIRSLAYLSLLLAALAPRDAAAQQHQGTNVKDTAKTSMHCSTSGGMMSGAMMGGSGDANQMQVMRLQPRHLIRYADELELSDSQLLQLEAMDETSRRVREEHTGAVRAARDMLKELFETDRPDPEQVRSVAQSAAWHQAELYAQVWSDAATARAALSPEQVDRASQLMAPTMCRMGLHQSEQSGQESENR